MADFTREQYAARIPACCAYQTMEGHESMMLCWGLAAAIRANREMDCTGCDLAVRGFWLARNPNAQQHADGQK